MKLLAFAASHRAESHNLKLVTLAAEHARALGAEIDIADYADFDMPLFNDTLSDNPPAAAKAFAQRAESADGIIIAMPEYNWSFPGSLKNIIDWTSLDKNNPMKGKTALLMCATPGARGGIVGLQQLKSPLEALHLHVFHKVFPLAHSHSAFDAQGRLADSGQQGLFSTIIKDYIQFTHKISHH